MKVQMDARRFEAKLHRIGAHAGQMALDIVNRLTLAGVEYSKMLAPVGRSGELRAGIQVEPATIVNGEAQGDWHAGNDHAPYTEFGTGRPGAAGEVANGMPRDPRAAGFTYTLQTMQRRRGGQEVMVDGWTYYDTVGQRFVHTVGQPARPHMYPAYLHVQERADGIAANAVRDALRRG